MSNDERFCQVRLYLNDFGEAADLFIFSWQPSPAWTDLVCPSRPASPSEQIRVYSLVPQKFVIGNTACTSTTAARTTPGKDEVGAFDDQKVNGEFFSENLPMSKLRPH